LVEDAFEKEGRRIVFQRARLTPKGRGPVGLEALGQVPLTHALMTAGKKTAKPTRRAKSAGGRKRRTERNESPLAPELRTVRLSEAKQRKVPAFRIYTDRVLDALCEARPQNEADLLRVPGVGPKMVAAHGALLLELCRKG